MTSIYLLDDQCLTRNGLQSLLLKYPGVNEVCAFKDANELTTTLSSEVPNLIFIDLDEEQTRMNLIKSLVDKNECKVIVLASQYTKQSVINLLNIGVAGILTKHCDEKEIYQAVDMVSKGDKFYCSDVIKQVAKISGNASSNGTLSPRELDVLNLITRGFSTVQIADKLNVSVHTINSHRKNILKKLDLSSPAQLIVYALENDILL